MQSKIKTKDSSTIQQVSAKYKNNFPADGKIGEQINISPQTHQDEISNNNKYNTLNTDKERQLKPQLAIINQHSNRSLNTSGKINREDNERLKGQESRLSLDKNEASLIHSSKHKSQQRNSSDRPVANNSNTKV